MALKGESLVTVKSLRCGKGDQTQAILTQFTQYSGVGTENSLLGSLLFKQIKCYSETLEK
jgi:hypothetical protein